MSKMIEEEPVKATVIILTYNQEGSIRRAIESVLRQRCDFKYEILIADDGSHDLTRQICQEYAELYPELIRIMPKAPNKGIVDNYFDALCEAKGDYIGDCAGDDEWLCDTRLHQQVEVLEMDTSLSAVCSDVEEVKKENNKEFRSILHGTLFANASAAEPSRIEGAVVLRELLTYTKRLPFILSSSLYRKSGVLKLLSTNPEVVRYREGGIEDIPIIAALGATGDILHIPMIGYRYYIDGESASNNLTHDKEYEFHARVTSLMRKLGDYYGLTPRDQYGYFREKFIYLATQIRHSGNPALIDDLRRRLKEWDLRLPLRGEIHLLLFKIQRLLCKT